MRKTLALLMLLAGLTMEARAETLIWNGTDGRMTWNTEDSNWLSDITAAKYANGDTVVFGAAGGGEVTPAGELAPASVLVDTSFYSYTFTGDGKLTGTMPHPSAGTSSSLPISPPPGDGSAKNSGCSMQR